MEPENKTYDCAIIGGGLAGLCLAIQLADQGIKVVLFERNEYPFHKVCGEYISMESWDFLMRLGLPLDTYDLPIIDSLGISSEKGFMLNQTLEMGGFGISRYSLDNYLYQLAIDKKVTILQSCKVTAVNQISTEFQEIDTNQGKFRATIICGSYGKYTPSFIQKNDNYLIREDKSGTNYIGVKYHIKSDLASNRIELHNFKDGYCGISKVDQDWHCLCYLTTAKNLQNNNKDIKKMEEHVLFKNPFLKNYFTKSEFIHSNPLVISNIQFNKKQTDVVNIFLLGDAAGSITPLCGNGMSMGMRASKLLAVELIKYFENKSSLEEVTSAYKKSWNEALNTRIRAGYYLQNLFGKKNTTHLALKFLSKTPGLMRGIISLTHGEKF
ncbi:NAD(P)/FAD-dependent oxidoreductase [Dyadobacter subterraneus]|uniref:FAD-dependent monooxygenase n=1 Tax=Dyadobacter subterraneus TaxID=2773304 RepID=A0ABR9WAK3_9BACT|nr:FAD-dependent oxidoreductase [Dyadobacter subterraneus]MBE9462507.1 FAD-dependent monooxygenase [Dyadobacter subterraneus]